MTITINGEQRNLDPDVTIGDLMREVVGTTRGTAIAIDGVVVPRGQWDDQRLLEGQQIELITAVQGG